MGNAVGMIAALLALAGLLRFQPPLLALPAALLVGLVVFHFTGLWDNAKMREALRERYRAEPLWEDGHRFFVGFASASYEGLLDPHQDVGWLLLTGSRLVFLGDRFQFDFALTDIYRLERGFSAHTLLGSGWQLLRGAREKREFVLRFESRDADRVFGLCAANRHLERALRAWLDRR